MTKNPDHMAVADDAVAPPDDAKDFGALEQKAESGSIHEADEVVLDPRKERKLLMKLDAVFVPIIMLTYLSCFLDRSNIGMQLLSIRHP